MMIKFFVSRIKKIDKNEIKKYLCTAQCKVSTFSKFSFKTIYCTSCPSTLPKEIIQNISIILSIWFSQSHQIEYIKCMYIYFFLKILKQNYNQIIQAKNNKIFFIFCWDENFYLKQPTFVFWKIHSMTFIIVYIHSYLENT